MHLHKLIIQNITWRGLYFFSLFLLNILVSRYFKAGGSGAIYYVINNLSFLLLLLSLSLESGATYYISREEISPQNTALFCLFWSLAGTLLSLFFLKWMAGEPSGLMLPKQEFIFGACSYVLGVMLTTYFTALFFAKQDFFLPNFILCSVTMLLVILLIISGNQPYVHRHFAVIYFSSFLLQGLMLTVVYFLKNPVWMNASLLSVKDLKKLFRYSLLALSANIVFFLVYRVDYWFVSKYCSITELGNYIQVSKLGQIFMLIPTTIASAIFIHTAAKKEQATASLKMIASALTMLYIFIIVCIIITGQWFFLFVYGPSFNLMYAPFLLLSPGIISLSTLALLTAYFAGRGKVLVNVKGACYALIFVVTGNFFLTPRYGIYAAAAVSSFGYIFYLAYVMRCFKIEHADTKLYDFFIPQVKDFKLLKKTILRDEK